ncbi:MAG: hypothetical protein HFJ53_01165 [Clostridia bacterium]|jgi:hypothetical protein|nr:hypothetical protein [Clostridia bacterium]
MEQEITITLEQYEELVKAKLKAEQYKNYFLENTQNNQITKAVTTIECKNLYELITEAQNKEEKLK